MAGDSIVSMLRVGACGVAFFAFLCATLAVSQDGWSTWEVRNLAADDAMETYSMGLSSYSVNAKIGFIEITNTGDFDISCDDPYPEDDYCESSGDDTNFYSKVICNIGVFYEKGSDEKINGEMRDLRRENRNTLLRGAQIQACKDAKEPRETAALYAIVAIIPCVLNFILTGLYFKKIFHFPKINLVVQLLFAVGVLFAFMCCQVYATQVASKVYTRGIEELGYCFEAMFACGCLNIFGFGMMLFDSGEVDDEDEKEEFEEESEISETSEQES